MKKLALGLLAVVVAALLAAPKIVGLSIEDAAIEAYSANMPMEIRSAIELRQNRFEGGWFSSEGEMAIHLLDMPAAESEIRFNFTVKHGPLLRTDQGIRLGLGEFHLSPKFSLQDYLSTTPEVPELPQIDLWFLLGFDEDITLNGSFAEFEYDDGTNLFSIAQSTFSGVFDADGAGNIAATLGEISFSTTNSAENLDIGAIGLRWESENFAELFAPSLIEFNIPSIDTSAPAQLQARGISFLIGVEDSEQIAGAVDSYQTVTVAEVAGDAPLSYLLMESELNNLNAEVVNWYNENMMDPETLAALDAGVQLDEFFEGAVLLLQHPLEFKYNVQVVANGGPHSARLTLNWLGIPEADRNLLDSPDIPRMISALQGQLSVELDAPSISTSPAMPLLKPYIEQGLLVEDGVNYRFNVSLSSDELRINDDIVPLDQLF